MPKDSQIDKKEVRKKKADNNDVTIATENMQNNPNDKKQSVTKNNR